MAATRYWSVEECGWVDPSASEDLLAEIAVPEQREDEPAQEPVDA